jgi:hypothetical protein
MYPSTPKHFQGEIKLMPPIRVKDVVNESIFIFEVNWIFNYPERLK